MDIILELPNSRSALAAKAVHTGCSSLPRMMLSIQVVLACRS